LSGTAVAPRVRSWPTVCILERHRPQPWPLRVAYGLDVPPRKAPGGSKPEAWSPPPFTRRTALPGTAALTASAR
jgi:hypothetical protein